MVVKCQERSSDFDSKYPEVLIVITIYNYPLLTKLESGYILCRKATDGK